MYGRGPKGRPVAYGTIVLLVVVAVLSGVLAVRFAHSASPIGAGDASRDGPVTYYRGALVPMSSVPMSSLQREVTCDGCPPAESGVQLTHDLRIASAVNLRLSDLPSGWRQVGPPPKASGDVALGVLDRSAALRFISCTGMPSSQELDVLYDKNQVLNVGSPAYALDGSALSGLTGPVQATLVSWVDMVAPGAHVTMENYLSSRYRRCASPLWGELLSISGESASVAGTASFRSGRLPEHVPLADIQIHSVRVSSPAHGMIMYITISNLPYALFVAAMGAGRVYASAVLGIPLYLPENAYPKSEVSSGFGFFPLVKRQLVSMAGRAIAAQRLR